MSRQKVSRNSPCPCGSGKKYKACCWKKAFDFVEDEKGTIFKSVPMHGELTAELQELRQEFIAKHGREPGPGDKLFEDLPPTEHLEAMIVKTMKEAGTRPEIIYAFEKTGRLVTADNRNLLTDRDLAEWDAAVDEYRAKNP